MAECRPPIDQRSNSPVAFAGCQQQQQQQHGAGCLNQEKQRGSFRRQNGEKRRRKAAAAAIFSTKSREKWTHARKVLRRRRCNKQKRRPATTKHLADGPQTEEMFSYFLNVFFFSKDWRLFCGHLRRRTKDAVSSGRREITSRSLSLIFQLSAVFCSHSVDSLPVETSDWHQQWKLITTALHRPHVAPLSTGMTDGRSVTL